MGDFNVKVGNERVDEVVGDHGLGQRNERGERLIDWTKMHDMIIGNTWLKHHPRKLWTWKSPGDNARNQIDYIMTNKTFRNSLLTVKTMPGADCDMNHVLLFGKIRIKLKKTKKAPGNTKLDLTLLKTETNIRESCNVTVRNRYNTLEPVQDLEDRWKNLKESIIQSAEETIPPVKKTSKKKWMTEDILQLMEKRRLSKNNKEEYEKIGKEITEKCNAGKEKWFDERCQEIESRHVANDNNMYKNIEEVTGIRTCSAAGCLKSKEGNIILEKDKILERWSEYIGKLYNDDRNERKIIKNNFEGPPILKDEIKSAIKQMKTGKALGPDGIATEMIEALEEFGVDILYDLLNEIYNTGIIQEDMSQSIFIALLKKPGATECEPHRTISLTSHATKILLRIIMTRARNKIKPEIDVTQCGFVEGKGTVNAIFVLRTIIERALEVNKDLYLCFIDYTKAFDKVRHEEIINILENLDMDGKDLRIIKNLYWKQTATVRMDNEVSNFQQIKRGVRQGCVLSLDLFSLYSEMIMHHLEGIPGIQIGGHNINNLRYADDTVLIVETEEDLQELLETVVKESEIKGLTLTNKKTEVMVVSRKNDIPTCKITIDNKVLQ